jgi:hypothetical protein
MYYAPPEAGELPMGGFTWFNGQPIYLDGIC